MVHAKDRKYYVKSTRILLGMILFLAAWTCMLGPLVETAVPAEHKSVYLPAAFSNYPDESYPIDKGVLSNDEVMFSSLMGTADRWIMYLDENEPMTLKVAPGNTADIVLSVLDSAGRKLVDEQNSSPAGVVETISSLPVEETGIYILLIQTVDKVPVDYATVRLGEDDVNLDFPSKLSDNDVLDKTLPANTDHFWLFNAQEGQIISFTVSPDEQSDAYLEFYGPQGNILWTIDDKFLGEPESVLDFPVLVSGMYGIRVGEFDYNPMSYQISFSST